jgi:hypothetical protein
MMIPVLKIFFMKIVCNSSSRLQQHPPHPTPPPGRRGRVDVLFQLFLTGSGLGRAENRIRPAINSNIMAMKDKILA